MMNAAPKPFPPETNRCIRCGQPAHKGWKYCPLCKLAVLDEMENAHYLTPIDFYLDWHGSGKH